MSSIEPPVPAPPPPSRGTRQRAIPPCDRTQTIPLSFGQERLWFFEQLAPGLSVYNQHRAYRLRGALNAGALARSLTEIVRRHEVLRTSLVESHGDRCQVVRPPAPVDFPIIDLSSLPAATRDAEIERVVRAEAGRLFQLNRDDLLRPRLLRIADDDHVLMWSTHHIANDGWSANVLTRELRALYDAYSQGADPSLTPLAVQYADFSAWQRQMLDDERVEKLVRYWRQALEGVPDTLELPTDRTRPAGMSFSGASCPISLSPSLATAIKTLAARERATPFMVLLAAFQVLMWRYSGQSQFLVGTPIAGRNRPELEGCLGLFINFLCLPARIGAQITFDQLLRQVRSDCLKAYEHQDLPFEMLVERLQPSRTPSRHPLAQVLFGLQPGAADDFTLRGVDCARVYVESTTSVFDLEWQLRGEQDGYGGAVIYNTDLWDDATIRRMIGHFEQILQRIVADPQQCVSDIELLSTDERRQVGFEFSAGPVVPVPDLPVHQAFEEQAARQPGERAVTFAGQSLSYDELNRAANRLAHELLARGIGRESRVAVFLERSLDSLVGLLAILKSGAVYVPLDPAEPLERLKLILADARPALVITQSRLTERLAAFTLPLAVIDELEQELRCRSDADPEVHIAGHDAVYMIYTSGSTGFPKGVVIEHRCLAAFLSAMTVEPGISRDDHLLGVTPVTFDISLLELLLPLMVGAALEIVSREVARSPDDLRHALERSRTTILQATPVTFRMLIESGWTGGDHLKVLCGGEAMQADLAAELLPRCRELSNMYGPTETTIWSTVQRIRRPEEARSIGRPIHNTRVYVLDSGGQFAPIGVPGELVIAGAGIARGYHERGELTAERFVADPVVPGARAYRTGDRVRWQSDGALEFFGRLDNQLKLRGYRIELGEIEQQLARHPSVQAAAVVVRNRAAHEAALAGFWTRRADHSATSAEVLSSLRESLPAYMVPAELHLLNELPLTTSGKVDRRALEARVPAAPAADVEAAPAAMTAVQRGIARIWQDVLRRPDVGLRSEFFQTGGHSLLALRVVARIEEQFGVRLPLRILFEATTLESLSAVVEELQRESRRTNDATPESSASRRRRTPPLMLAHLETIRAAAAPKTVVWVGQMYGLDILRSQVVPEAQLLWLKMDGLHTDVFEEMPTEARARRYADELLEACGGHQFALAGYCISGLIAYALAVELEVRTGIAPAVALFEPTVPPHERRARVLEAALRDGEPGTRAVEHGRRWGWFERMRFRLQLAGERAICRAARLLGRPIPAQLRWNYYFPSLYRQACAYSIPPYRGRVGLVAGARYDSERRPVWAERAVGGLSVCRLETADHGNLFDAGQAAEWAPWLDEFVRENFQD
ncbi:MAG: amino acid adenylation domain-containing protein [Planctomycetaceae bacterium]|nr:amino acid adenylation domain-containing protein [Planctomycetaceae bacterium]